MYFSRILIAVFAARALGEKAPGLPNLAAVTDAIVPTVADDALVLRGRGAYPEVAAVVEAATVATDGGEDAATALVAAAALEETANLVLDEVMAAETAGAPAGLRGAAMDKIQVESGGGQQDLKDYKYKTVKINASVTRSVLARLAPGSGDSWGSTKTVTEQHRTTRKQLYEETEKNTLDISSTIESSMTMGASFPVQAISVSGEVSQSFSDEVSNGIESSSTTINDYEKESMTEVTTETTHTYTANSSSWLYPGKVKVVFKEVWKLGDTVFKVAYLNCDEAESKKAGWASEVEVVTMEVGVDLQWYHIKNGNGKYLQAGNSNEYFGFALTIEPLESLVYEQQWALIQRRLISRSEKYAQVSGSLTVDDAFHGVFSDNGADRKYDYSRLTGTQDMDGYTQIKDGYGYCLGIIHNYPGVWNAHFDWVKSEVCGGYSKEKQWSFITVAV